MTSSRPQWLRNAADYILDNIFDILTIAAAAYIFIRHEFNPYGPNDIADLAAWKEHELHTATRAAALLAADLPACVQVLAELSGMQQTGVDLVSSSPVISDLLRFWSSQRALDHRTQAGMLG